MVTPNYQTYTIEELLEAKASIDVEAWPERYQQILARIAYLNQQDPESKATHNQIVFADFCHELHLDLTTFFDDEILSIKKLFGFASKKELPTTFEGEVCPICAGELELKESFVSWRVACHKCKVYGKVRKQRNHHY